MNSNERREQLIAGQPDAVRAQRGSEGTKRRGDRRPRAEVSEAGRLVSPSAAGGFWRRSSTGRSALTTTSSPRPSPRPGPPRELIERPHWAPLDYVEGGTDGFPHPSFPTRQKTGLIPAQPHESDVTSPQVEHPPAQQFTARAARSAHRAGPGCLVRMVALTGQWWMDQRKVPEGRCRAAPGQPSPGTGSGVMEARPTADRTAPRAEPWRVNQRGGGRRRPGGTVDDARGGPPDRPRRRPRHTA